MTQYKKVTTCCGNTIKEGKPCDCPCQLITETSSLDYIELATGDVIEAYNGRPIGLHGEAELTVSDPTGNERVVINFTSNGVIQPIILDLATKNINKLFSFKNVTRVEITDIIGGGNVSVDINCDGMTEPCS
ncbi:hypothetical protein [Cytobacillus sp. IB215316]|uniref:hypothetical protein n=1 Tax=Cytobacillus sp. IB215316 TaxID=3097354 RepID=UPI002A104F21|nr:hypothetical protein [Cytobacillus sp. IB215316]MDX8363202.1 hypothetical protein [Cytobacillus sp. IB215316]